VDKEKILKNKKLDRLIMGRLIVGLFCDI